jgi:hypothetical protein
MPLVSSRLPHLEKFMPVKAFAAMAASEGVSGFACDYVGQMPYAKHYGTFPTYHVHRA